MTKDEIIEAVETNVVMLDMSYEDSINQVLYGE